MRPYVHGQQHREHARLVDGHLEDRPLAHALRDAQGHGEPALDLALAVAARAVEDEAARPFAGRAGREEGNVERKHAARGRFLRGEEDLAAEAARTDGPPQVTGGRTAHEGPREGREAVLEAAERFVVTAALLRTLGRLVGGLNIAKGLAHTP